METYGEQKVQGFFILSDLDLVKKMKGPLGITELQKRVPELDLKHISPIKKYPLEIERKFLREMAIVLYGNDSPQSWRKLGAHELYTIQNVPLGKVILSLIGKDMINLIKNAYRPFSVFAPFIKLSYQIINEKNVIFTMEYDPYPKEYYLGSLEAFMDMLNIKGAITVHDDGHGKHSYHIIVF